MRALTLGEPIWQAHRTHFYQLATDPGFTVSEVVARGFAVNVGLAAQAVFTVIKPSKLTDVAALLAGIVLVSRLLVTFTRGNAKK